MACIGDRNVFAAGRGSPVFVNATEETAFEEPQGILHLARGTEVVLEAPVHKPGNVSDADRFTQFFDDLVDLLE